MDGAGVLRWTRIVLLDVALALGVLGGTESLRAGVGVGVVAGSMVRNLLLVVKVVRVRSMSLPRSSKIHILMPQVKGGIGLSGVGTVQTRRVKCECAAHSNLTMFKATAV